MNPDENAPFKSSLFSFILFAFIIKIIFEISINIFF